jgi:hypothetical protein
LHARQVLVATLHTGLPVTLQSELSVHSTQVPLDAPVVAHAGSLGSRAAHSGSVEQARQALASQMGFVETPHWVLIAHSTHAPVVAQMGVAVLRATHSEPAPHARQAFDVPSQMGAAPVHEVAVQAGVTSASA